MKTAEQYIEEHEKIQKEIDIIKSSGLDLLVRETVETTNFSRTYIDENDILKREFETRDYALADRIEIKDKNIIFIHDLETSQGNLTVFCRHKFWPTDTKRYVQYTEGGYPTSEIKRHDINDLCSFYQEQGVKPELIEELRTKLEEIYNK